MKKYQSLIEYISDVPLGTPERDMGYVSISYRVYF